MATTQADGTEAPAVALLRMIRGFQLTQMIYVAAKLDIADLVAGGAKSIDALAAATGTSAPSLYRLLRGLAGFGIFAEDEQGRYGLTPMAALLQKDVPNTLRAAILYLGEPSVQQIWGDMRHSVETGEDAFHHLHGMSAWAYREQHPEINALFNDYMTVLTRSDIEGVTTDYDFSGIHTLVDVGGGHGALLAAILTGTPGLHGIVFDQAHVASGANALLTAAGVADRCEVVVGDFFAEVPPDKDAYILKSIIHDWDDADSIRILKNCRQAIQAEGKLLVFEYVIPPGNDPHPSKMSDVNMLVGPGGQERTEDAYRTLLAQAGFRLTRIVTLKSAKSIIEAVPV